MLRILSKLKLESTSQDASFERSLAFMLENSHRQSQWLTLKGKGKIILTEDDLDWIPEKWWKLVTGEVKRDAVPTRINRRQFEACVCLQMVRELKSGDLCVIGSDAYSDHRNGCDLNLKQPQQKERQRDLFFAKTESIVELLKLMPVNLKCQQHPVVSSAYRQDKIAVL